MKNFQDITFAELPAYLIEFGHLDVKCLKPIDDMECTPEEGFLGSLTGAIAGRDKDLITLTIDLSGFEELNKGVAKADYFDENQNPTKTVFETNFYHKVDSIYFDVSEKVSKYFELVSEKSTKLIEQWRASGSSLRYINWLEHELTLRMGS